MALNMIALMEVFRSKYPQNVLLKRLFEQTVLGLHNQG
jgi:hypothetical protein